MRSLRPFVLARPRTIRERKRRNSRWGARRYRLYRDVAAVRGGGDVFWYDHRESGNAAAMRSSRVLSPSLSRRACDKDRLDSSGLESDLNCRPTQAASIRDSGLQAAKNIRLVSVDAREPVSTRRRARALGAS